MYLDTMAIPGVKSGPRECRKINKRIEAVVPLMMEFFQWTSDADAREEYIRKLAHRVTNDPSPDGHELRVAIKETLWRLSNEPMGSTR